MATPKVLVLASEPISGEVVRQAIGAERAEDAEVLVVAPALNSKLRFLASDPDAAIERAEEVQEESVQRMNEEGLDAAGDTGESDPLQAIEDALATFRAEEIVLCIHPEGEQNWLEDGVVDEAKERFPDRQVRHFEVGLAASGGIGTPGVRARPAAATTSPRPGHEALRAPRVLARAHHLLAQLEQVHDGARRPPPAARPRPPRTRAG